MIRVYQFQLTSSEIEEINRGERPALLYALRQIGRGKLDFILKWQHRYQQAAKLETNELELAFELMNLWEESPNWDKVKVTRIGHPRSLSVGDIIQRNGDYYVCASFGWDYIPVGEITTLYQII